MKFLRTIPTFATAVAVSALGLTACSDQQGPPTVVQASVTDVPVTVEVSSATAKVGSRIAVAMKLADAAGSIGGIQGSLEFDPTRLTYVGQSAQGSAIAVVNAKANSTGSLRFAAFNPMGVSGRVALFVFETKSADYLSSLRYVPQVAATAGANRRTLNTRVVGTIVNGGLQVPGDAAMMTIADWAARINPVSSKNPAVAAGPGEYRLNLRYGDVDFNGAVGLTDYLAVANAAVGNDQLIVGTDGPAVDVDLVIAGNVFPTNSNGACGTEANGTRVLDLNDFLSIANVAVGNPETCAGNVIPGRGPLPTARTAVSGTITGDVTWTKDRVWQLDGLVTITNGATLTIEPGTRIEGNSAVNPSALITERGGVLLAAGTLYEPIVFTCTGTKVPGCWGGVWLSGKSAPNVGVPATGTGLGPSPSFPARTVTFQGTTYNVPADAGGCNQLLGEANTPAYGGCTDADFNGVLRYVRIEYAGFTISSNRELNGLTLAGVGSQTVVENVQVHGGSDDGVEFFAGTVNTRNLVITGAQDDSFDGSFGYRGNSQFVIIQSDAGDPGNDSRAIEFDGNETASAFSASPRTSAGMYNFTVIGNLTTDGQTAAIILRRGTAPTISNSIFDGWRYMVEIRDADTCTPGSVIRYSTFVGFRTGLANPSVPPACAATEDAIITAGVGNVVRQTAAPQIDAILVAARNTQTPDWRMLGTPAAPVEGNTDPTLPAGIQSVNYRGAVGPLSRGQIPWYSGWTRAFATATTP